MKTIEEITMKDQNLKPIHQSHESGAASVFVLIMGIVSAIVLGGLVLVASVNQVATERQQSYDQALAVAEAGVNYYRWHLAHNPADYQDGTGQPGPYTHEYKDPQGKVVGTYSLEVIPPEPGYTIVTIKSTGWTAQNPLVKRTVRVRYGIPSLAKYSFLHNANVWFGQGLTVHGRVLSNGGIRQDGINDSTIQSAQATYTCGSETGCSPAQSRPGVWGAGGPSALWEFPVPPADFDAINVDFNTMRTAAQADNTHWGPIAQPGYHVVFEAAGIARIYRVTSTGTYRGYDTSTGCTNLNQRITGESLLTTVIVDEPKVLFFEDTVWVEGTVKGNVTLVAARFPIDSYNEDMWITNNVVYAAKDGKNHLGLIAQRNIYMVKDVPNTFEINAALLAKNGKIIRHHYRLGSCQLYNNAMRNMLIIYGAVISNQKSYWNWGQPAISGFTSRDVTYDSSLYLFPPPYFPASGDYEVMSWDEE